MSFIKTLFFIALIVGLAYGGYIINQKYMGPGKKAAETQTPTTNNISLFICPKDVPAFDTKFTNSQIGYFVKNTQVQLGSSTNFPGMTPVTYLDPNGKIITALCKNEDLKEVKEEPVAVKPLDTPTDKGAAVADKPDDVKKNIVGNAPTSRPPEVVNKLGPKKNVFQSPSSSCGGSQSIIKFGKSPQNTIKLGETPEIEGKRVGKPSCGGPPEE